MCAPQPFNRLIDAIDPTGRSISFTYDASARLTGMTDAAGRTVSETLPDGGVPSNRPTPHS